MNNNTSNQIEFLISQKMIDDYAKASKDFNPIHINKEFASKSLFKRRIAHGMLTLSIVMEYLYEIYSDKMLNDTLVEARFKNPVYAGEKIIILHEEKLKEKISVICRKENGEEAISASVTFK